MVEWWTEHGPRTWSCARCGKKLGKDPRAYKVPHPERIECDIRHTEKTFARLGWAPAVGPVGVILRHAGASWVKAPGRVQDASDGVPGARHGKIAVATVYAPARAVEAAQAVLGVDPSWRKWAAFWAVYEGSELTNTFETINRLGNRLQAHEALLAAGKQWAIQHPQLFAVLKAKGTMTTRRERFAEFERGLVVASLTAMAAHLRG